MSPYYERVQNSVSFLKSWLGKDAAPDVCVVLGSGLASSIPSLENEKVISYAEIPGFKNVTVEGHVAELKVGTLSGVDLDGKKASRRIAFLRGRNHGYEGNNAAEVVHNVRSLIGLGAKGVVLTNASGCLNADWQLGAVMVLRDHINKTNTSPIYSEFGEGFGKRFVDLTQVYDLQWQQVFKTVAQSKNQTIYDGVYYGVIGPDYETPAEIRMMKMLGADAVGMSTVLEAIAAKHLGAKVAALSCLTNYGSGIQGSVLEHTHVIDMGKRFSKSIAELLMTSLISLPL